MITTWSVLQQSIANLKQRFANPPRYFTKEDFVYLTNFLQDTQEYLYTTVLNVDIISQNLNDVISVSSNIDAINNIGGNIDLLESIENVLSEIIIITNNITALVNISSNLSELLLTNDNALIATTQASIATNQASIATTQASIATTQAGIATTKANEANESSIDALTAQQAAEEALQDITSIFNQNFEEYVNFAAFPSIGEENTIYVALNNGSQYRWSGTIYNQIGGGITLGETSETAYRGDRGKIAYDHSQITTGNPHGTTASNIGAEPANANIQSHISSTANPHSVTKTQVGLSNVDNTSDVNKPVSTAQQTALNLKANSGDLTSHTGNTSNPHATTKAQVGLENVDNTSDVNKPISTLQQTALDLKVDKILGKGLSTNDYTTEEKNKLNAIEAEANKYVHPSTHEASIITQDSTHRFVTDTEKTTWNSKADLTDGKVPSSQLPSYVDDVLEYSNVAAFPVTGEAGIIYIDLSLNKTYRWSGNIYVEIGSGGVSLGETSSTAYRGDRGKIAYDHSQSVTGNPHGIVKADIGLGNVDNTSDVNKPVSTAQAAAIGLKENSITAGTTSQYWRGDKTWQTLNSTSVGLANVDNTSDANKPISTATQTALDLKVDKVTGKGLSTEDYTTAEKTKLADINAGGQANNISDVNATDLTDGGNSSLHYHTTDRTRNNHIGTQSADTIVNGTNNKVFSATEKTKLASIAENAEVNVQPDWNIVDNTQDGYIKNKPSAFDGYIDRIVEILITDPNGDAITVKNNIVIYTIPLEFNGYNLIRAHATLTTPSTSGLPTVQIKNINDNVDMLSTPITIDVNEYNSYSAVTSPVINNTYDDVATGDRLGINLTAAGTGAKGLTVILTFKKP